MIEDGERLELRRWPGLSEKHRKHFLQEAGEDISAGFAGQRESLVGGECSGLSEPNTDHLAQQAWSRSRNGVGA